MIAEEQVSPPQTRPILLSPWLVFLAALLLYLLTLNHWVTLQSASLVATVTGWQWHPAPLPWRQQFEPPLLVILTAPFRVLPLNLQPVVLNVFGAFCASLILALLAASVRLMPHDRTREQRLREPGAYALLSIKGAFVPPLFAVLMLGLSSVFWRQAVVISSQMIDLLFFALVVYCILRYRITQNERLLGLSAFIYGLGMANDGAFLGFLPVFVGAMLWIKGLQFFTLRFLGRTVACGIAGFLLCLLVPAMASLGPNHDNFWFVLHRQLGTETYFLRSIPKYVVAIAALPTLVPVLFAAIRWPSFEGEISAAGNAINRVMLHMLHIVFLVLPIVTFFNFKYSPNLLMRESPTEFLTFYYAAAMAIGYFSGYLLLVCGRRSLRHWEQPSAVIKALDGLLVGVVYAASLAAPVLLAVQAYPRIAAENSPALARFADSMLAGLPARALVLSDDPIRLYLLQAAASRRGRNAGDILIDTREFGYREYLESLVARYPELKPLMRAPKTLPRILPTRALVDFLYRVNSQYPIYYLQPSFGYYFEAFYEMPHGVVFEMNRFTNNAASPPLATAAQIKYNDEFWQNEFRTALTSLPRPIRDDIDAVAVRNMYSVSMDCWGVELQRASQLKPAGAMFDAAYKVDTNNFVASINGQYNGRLQHNNHKPIDVTDDFYQAVSLYGGFLQLLKYGGTPDEPNLDLEWGQAMAQNGQLRQAAAMFERRLQLLPGDLPAQLAMAKTYVDLHQPDRALALVSSLRGANQQVDPWQLIRIEALASVAKNNYGDAEKRLQSAVASNPGDAGRLDTLAQVYRGQGYDLMHAGKNKQAGMCFSNAVDCFDRELKALNVQGFSEAQNTERTDVLLRKAELQMMTRSFSGAVDTLSQVMDLDPSNRTALLNRAIAEAQMNQMQAAKEDYQKLRQLLPAHPYVVDYGLAEIAAAEKNKDDEIHYLHRYLTSAPDDTQEYQRIKARLQKLENH